MCSTLVASRLISGAHPWIDGSREAASYDRDEPQVLTVIRRFSEIGGRACDVRRLVATSRG